MAGPPFTIDTTTPAPTNLISVYPANEVLNRTNILNWLSWLSNPTTGQLYDQAFTPGQIFPAGSVTKMLFYQAAAPTGWTQITTVNDATLRIVSGGTGGSAVQGLYGFSTLYGPTVNTLQVTPVALTVNQLPPMSYTFSGTTANETQLHSHAVTVTGTTDVQGLHQHNVGATYVGSGTGSSGGYILPSGTGAVTDSEGLHGHNVTASGTSGAQIGNHNHAFSGTTNTQGGGQTHNHTFALNVLYVDMILCTRT